MKKVDGYDGYKFGMTLDQALQIKPFVKQKTPCGYKGVPVCLEYATTVSGFPARVDIQFEGSAPLLSRILLTISSFEVSVRHTCAEVGKVVLGLLADKYGKDPVVDDRKTTWTALDRRGARGVTFIVKDATARRSARGGLRDAARSSSLESAGLGEEIGRCRGPSLPALGIRRPRRKGLDQRPMGGAHNGMVPIGGYEGRDSHFY